MKALHVRLSIPQAATALPDLLRKAAGRLEAWIYDHADTSRWHGEDVELERPTEVRVVHHYRLDGMNREQVRRHVEAAMQSSRFRRV